jgi:hypothetical protein
MKPSLCLAQVPNVDDRQLLSKAIKIPSEVIGCCSTSCWQAGNAKEQLARLANGQGFLSFKSRGSGDRSGCYFFWEDRLISFLLTCSGLKAHLRIHMQGVFLQLTDRVDIAP